MKTITNRKFSYEVQEFSLNGFPLFNEDGSERTKIVEVDTGKLIMDSIKRMANPQTGFTYDEIESITNVKNAIKAQADGEIKLEDADFNFVKSRVSTMTWNIPSIEFVNFKKYIDSIS